MSTCSSLLERMINTVPSEVILSDLILPIPFTARDYLLSINQDGTLNLQVTADVLAPALNNNRVVTLHWNDRESTSCASSACSVSSIQTTQDTSLRNGFTLQSYKFSVNVNATISFSNFWFTVDEDGNGTNITTQNNGGMNYPVDDFIVNVPAYTCGILFGSEPYIARITTAVRIDPSASAPINVTVEASFQNQTTFIPILSTVQASLSTSPLISPIPELYVYYAALVPGDTGDVCAYDAFEFSATIGKEVHTGPRLIGPCTVRAFGINSCFECDTCFP
ncbi:hypothetical protein MSAN_01667000 [Mycena sanguinolenta]|uniref:Uncharacterized protein n=1 Tax=Mycena sanguinolenta TaxID=230812 RepID=A0A8H6Y1N8_9AGAR|nr:hypothetical protein MSAN_01667000 [Mycena sanguinolenta]